MAGIRRLQEMISGTRRTIIKKLFYSVATAMLSFYPWSALVRSAAAKLKRQILPANTPMASLINKNPRFLDTRNLEPIPLSQFGTMGLSDYTVETERWRLTVTGQVEKPLSLSFNDILKLPALEKNVLLICPGVFANFGRWKGISIAQLLKAAHADNRITHITIRGPEGPDEKSKRFTVSEIQSDTVFLAYDINGKMLPQRHGYPLRAVAEGYFGFDWIKFVHQLEVEKT
jgi:sulfoxide reductase catalytic subunit YedY